MMEPCPGCGEKHEWTTVSWPMGDLGDIEVVVCDRVPPGHLYMIPDGSRG